MRHGPTGLTVHNLRGLLPSVQMLPAVRYLANRYAAVSSGLQGPWYRAIPACNYILFMIKPCGTGFPEALTMLYSAEQCWMWSLTLTDE